MLFSFHLYRSLLLWHWYRWCGCFTAIWFPFFHYFFFFSKPHITLFPSYSRLHYTLPILLTWQIPFSPLLCLLSIPYSYYLSSPYPLKIIFLSVSRLIFFFPFIYYFYSLSTFVNLSSFVVDTSVVVGGIFCWCGFCLLGCFVLAAPVLSGNSIQDEVGVVTLSQPAGGENPPRNKLKTTKIQFQQESPQKLPLPTRIKALP